MRVGLFFQATSDRKRGHSLKLCQEKFKLYIRSNFFIEMVVPHWNGLPDEVVESLSPEIFKSYFDATLRDMV